MKKRLCFIGNSHLAAVKLGWDEIAGSNLSAFEATFFGAPRDFMQRLELVGSKLVPADEQLREALGWTSNGRAEIDTQEYDAFVLVALNWSFTALGRIYGNYRTLEQDQTLRYLHLVSEECFGAAAHGWFDNSAAATITKKLRSVTDAPIYLMPEPMRSAGILKSKEVALWRHVSTHRDGEAMMAFFDEKCRDAEQRYGLRVLPQPAATLQGRFFTAPAYSTNSVRLAAGMSQKHRDDDYAHMNADYGAQTLKDLAAQL